MMPALSLANLAALMAVATNPPLTLHPLAKPLPFGHQGPFVTTADGGVLCIEATTACRSADEGRTWTSTPLFGGSSRYRVSDERALLRTRSGVIIAGWMNGAERQAPQTWNWGAKDARWTDFVLPTYVCRSLDDGRTWTTPVKLSEPWCGCIHSLIELRSGRIVLVGQEIIPEWRHATVMFVSDDQGQTWQRSNLLDYGVGRHDHAGSIEGTVIERQDGTLYLLLRTESGYLWQATSSDGLQWEGLRQTSIPSVTCCAQMARLTDGRIALLWNAPPRHAPQNRSSRSELSLAFSADDARTWTKPVVVAAKYGDERRTLASDLRVSYPYLYERRPGELWITTMQGGLRMRISATDLDKAAIPVYQPPPAPVPKPGGLVMFGDSTTATRVGAVRMVYADRVQEALQNSGSGLSVTNAGLGSSTTREAKQRLVRDVLAYRPRLVVMQFGINDSAVDVWKMPPAIEPRISLTEFEDNLRTMIQQCHAQQATVILMTTNPLRWTPALRDLYGKPPYRPEAEDGFESPTLARYNDAVRRLAGALRVPLVDVRAAYPEFAKAHHTTVDGLLLDGMHPNDLGHQLVAELLLPLIRSLLR